MTVTKISLTPHRARSAPGTAPKAAPPAKPARSASGSMTTSGSAPPTAKATPVVTMAPAYIWPSTPMLKKPPWRASITAMLPSRSGEILLSVCAMPATLPSELERIVRKARTTSPRMARMKSALTAAASATATR